MLKRDRQALLDDLGEQRLEVGWDPYMGFVLSSCWYMLFLFLLPGPLASAYLPVDNDLKVAIWFLAPIPFTVATWFWYRLHNLQRKIVFSQDRFEFFNRNGSTFTFRWVEIQGIKKFRQTLTITKTDGTSVKVVIPQVKTSRDKSWFDALIASYLPPNNAKTRARKLATGSLIFSLTCLTLAVAMGRPRMMKPDQEIPFVMIDYINLGLWAIAVTGVIIGSIGIFGFLEAFGSSKQREVEPELKNAFEVRVEKNFGWLESIELEPGRKYRYVEPEGLKKALRSQRMGLLGIVAVLLIVIIVLSSMILSDHRSRASAITFLILLSSLVLLLVISLSPSYLRFATSAFLVDDELSLEDDVLQVKSASGVKKYDWSTRQAVGEVTKIQGTPAPFSRIEWVGSKPDRYMIDRRYLVECEPGP